MLIDVFDTFSDDQAITGTAVSDDIKDIRVGSDNPTVDVAMGEEWRFSVIVTETFDALTSLTITLESDSTSDLATSPTVHFTSGAIALADLTAGSKVVDIALPRGDYEAFLGARYTVTGANPTVGQVSAQLTRHTPGVPKEYANRSEIIV